MARRRLNTKLLGITVTVLVAVIAGYLIWRKFLVKENPQKYVDAGREAVRQQDWPRAAANFGKAASLLPKDVGVWMDYGLAASRIDDNDSKNRAIRAFQQAVQLDPQRKDAWHFLLDSSQNWVDFLYQRQAQTKTREQLTPAMGALRESGVKLAKLEADNPDPAIRARVRSVIPILNIQQWIINVPIPQTAEERSAPLDKQLSDEQKVNASLVELTQLLRDDPKNVRAASAIAMAKLRQAQLAMQRNQPTDAYSLLDEAAGVFDEPLRAEPKFADMYWAKFETYTTRLAPRDPRPEKRQGYSKTAREALETAQSLVETKEQNRFVMYKTAWAQVLASTDPGRAEKVLQEVIEKFPDEIRSRVALARILQRYSTRRSDGLDVLSKISDSLPSGASASRRAAFEQQMYDVNLARADIQIDLFMVAPNQPERERLSGDIQKTLDSLANGHADDWQYLKVKGRYQLKNGRIRDAVQTLANADRISTQEGRWDSELLRLEADAYQLAEQNEEAIKVLERGMADPMIANNVGTHMVLARLYLSDHRIQQARSHLDWLSKVIPDDPGAIKLQITALDPVTDKEAINKQLQRLPENTPEQMLDKARVAKMVGNDVDTERLLKSLHDANPKDVGGIVNLGSFYLQTDRKDEARRMVEEALAAAPGDPSLMILSDAIAGKNDRALDTMRKQIESKTDPFEREMLYAGLARNEGKMEEELQRLQNAEKLQPNNITVLQRLFIIHVGARDFEKAELCVNKLTALDADQAHGMLFKINLALAKGEVQSAVAIGRQLTNDFKEFSQSWEALGEALQAAGQFDSAVAQYKVALDKQATNLKALRNLIDCNYKLGRLDDARTAIAEARRKFPDNTVYRDMQLQHELTYGDPETVLPALREEITKKPTDIRGYQLLSRALVRASSVKRAKGQPDEAVARANEARDVLKQAVDRWPDDVSLVLGLATASQQAGDFSAAEAVLKALAERPRWKEKPVPAIALAELYTQAHKLDLAEAALRGAAAKNPSNADIQLRLAAALQLQQKYDEGLKVLDDRLELLPVRKARTELLVSAGRAAQAETELIAALKAATPAASTSGAPPTTSATAINAAPLTDLLLFVYVAEQKYEEARKLATEVIATNPGNLSAYYYRAQVNMVSRTPDLDAAITDLSFVRERAPDHIESRLAMAECYARKGDVDGGIREIESALRASPGNKQVRLKLLDLYASADPPRWIDAETALSDGFAMPQFKDDPDLLRRAAGMWARRGESRKALDAIRKAMAQVPDKSVLVRDYLEVLLLTRSFELLAQETAPLVAGPNCPWWVFDYRARAKARAGDTTGATTDFNAALNAAGTESTHATARVIALNMVTELGVDKAVEIISPRAQNSAMWKLVVIPLYERKSDRSGAVQLAESAMPLFSTMTPAQQDELLSVSASLYLTSNPPIVDKAVAIYEQILQRHPQDYQSMNNLAYILSEQSNPPRLTEALNYAQRAYDEAKKRGTPDLMVVDTRAWIMILNGRLDEGIGILHQIVDRATFPDARYHLAEGYLRKNLPEDAQRELRAATELVEAAKTAKRVTDSALEAKIKAAVARADKMVIDKTQTKAGP